MVRASVSLLWALVFSAVAAQNPTSTGSTRARTTQTSVQSSSSVTSSPKTTTTQDAAHFIASLATSLLTHYYPSETITDFATLTLPSTLVVGGTTYTVPTPTTTRKSTKEAGQTTHAHRPTPNSEAAKQPHDSMSDKTLAIIIGVVIGCLALLVMAVVFCCLHRRRKQTGSFFMPRRNPSTRSNGSWFYGRRSPSEFGTTTYVSGGSNAHREPKLPRVSMMARRNTPPVAMHPALHEQSSRSTSGDNPFYTPQERSTTNLNPQELDSHHIQHVELDHHEPAQRRSSSSIRGSRPPTPFSPMMMAQMPGPASRPQLHVNPFSSPEDREADDVVSPIVPARSPGRRHSPMVHYPSYDEVSDFNFSGDESDRYRDSGDGWHPRRERRSGRYEMA